jgi:hypothetical protein
MVDPRDMGSLGPYGRKRDRLWVKESWRPRIAHGCAGNTCDCASVSVQYASDKEDRFFADRDVPDEWTMPKSASRGFVSPLYMPRWASRILLEMDDIRVERVQEIADADAIAEGVETATDYARIWDAINGRRESDSRWEQNPWVWVISFRVIETEKAEAVG